MHNKNNIYGIPPLHKGFGRVVANWLSQNQSQNTITAAVATGIVSPVREPVRNDFPPSPKFVDWLWFWLSQVAITPKFVG